MFYILIIFTILLNLIFTKQVSGQSFQFSITDNNISFSNPSILEFETLPNHQEIEKEVVEENLNFYLVSKAQQFSLKEFFDYKSEIKINNCYSIEFAEEKPLAIAFEYLIESEEDLLAFDEPAFYITLESENTKELIFAKTIAQSAKQWQKVVLDLSNYVLEEKKLVFCAGNLIDQEKKTEVYLRNLSSQVIVWHDSDRLFFSDKEIQNFNDYVDKSYIEINEQIWPIYQFEKKEITDLEYIREFDDSLTLLFSSTEEKINHNHQCFLTCDQDERQHLSQLNYYLLPQMIIKDFWPNLNDKVLLNIKDFPCSDSSKLIMECL